MPRLHHCGCNAVSKAARRVIRASGGDIKQHSTDSFTVTIIGDLASHGLRYVDMQAPKGQRTRPQAIVTITEHERPARKTGTYALDPGAFQQARTLWLSAGAPGCGNGDEERFLARACGETDRLRWRRIALGTEALDELQVLKLSRALGCDPADLIVSQQPRNALQDLAR